MAQLRISRDERYPWFDIDEEAEAILDVDDETAERWRRALAECERVQSEIRDELAKNPDYWDGRYWHI